MASGKVIIFPKLEDDFAMGVPGDEKLYQLFLKSLRVAINKIHPR
jgi:hypothetical protein